MAPPLVQFAPDALPTTYATAVDAVGRVAGAAGAAAGGIGLALSARETYARWGARAFVPFTVGYAAKQLSSASRDLYKIKRGVSSFYKPSAPSYLPGSSYTKSTWTPRARGPPPGMSAYANNQWIRRSRNGYSYRSPRTYGRRRRSYRKRFY